MRIAVFHNLPSGGAKRTVQEQVKRLVENHTLDLYTLSTADMNFADIRPYVGEVTVEPFEAGRLFRSPFGRLNQGVRTIDLLRLRGKMKQLAARIDAGDYDVALIHPCMFTFSPTITRYLRTPTLYYRHDPIRWLHEPEIPRPYKVESRWRAALDRFDPVRGGYFKLLLHEDTIGMRSATRVVTNSCFVREALNRTYGIAPSVVYHGVDIDLFRPDNHDRKNYVLSVGAISPFKGYDFIIEGLARIPGNQRPELVLVGNVSLADENNYLASLAERHGVRLTIREMITDEELVRLYNQALCTVYTPVMEPFGLVPLESMACETPVAGIAEGGVRETIVHGETGYLVGRDPDELARTISHLISNPAEIEDMGRRGRRRVEQYWTWDRSLASLEVHLRTISEPKSGKDRISFRG